MPFWLANFDIFLNVLDKIQAAALRDWIITTIMVASSWVPAWGIPNFVPALRKMINFIYVRSFHPFLFIGTISKVVFYTHVQVSILISTEPKRAKCGSGILSYWRLHRVATLFSITMTINRITSVHNIPEYHPNELCRIITNFFTLVATWYHFINFILPIIYFVSIILHLKLIVVLRLDILHCQTL